MALSSNCIWEVRTSGSDSNGGFFNPAASGVDYSQQNTPQLSLSDVSTNGTTTVTSAAGGFTAVMVGNGINIGGTIYEIVGRTDTNTITIDRAASAGSLQIAKVGGALASPGMASGAMVAGNWLWIRGGTYNFTSSAINVSGGRLSLPTGASNGREMKMEGYSSVRGDMVWGAFAPVIFTASVAGPSSYFVTAARGSVIRNIRIIGNYSISGINNWWGFSMSQGRIENCQARTCDIFSFNITGASAEQCFVDGNGTNNGCFAGSGTFIDCAVSGIKVGSIFGLGDHATVIRPVVYGATNNSAISCNSNSDCMFEIYEGRFYNCQTGILNSSTGRTIWKVKDSLFVNCVNGIATGSSAATSNILVSGCGFYGNTTDIGGPSNNEVVNKISLSSNPFVDAANGDMRLTAATAVYLKSQGFPVRNDWEQLPLAFSPIGSSLISRAARLSC